MSFQSANPWISKCLFEKLLRMDFPNDDIVIHNYLLKAALGKGENYMSQMIRATVEYSTNGSSKEINFILKTAISGEGLDDKMVTERRELFSKEIAVYNEVLPIVDKLLQEIGIKTKLHGR